MSARGAILPAKLRTCCLPQCRVLGQLPAALHGCIWPCRALAASPVVGSGLPPATAAPPSAFGHPRLCCDSAADSQLPTPVVAIAATS